MRVSVSNLAWDVTEDSQVASLLKEFSIDAIDIAPGKYFPVLADASESEILSVKNVWLVILKLLACSLCFLEPTV